MSKIDNITIQLYYNNIKDKLAARGNKFKALLQLK